MSLKGTCVISTDAISREKKIAQIGERIRVRRRRLNRGRSLCFKRRWRRQIRRRRKRRKRRRRVKKLEWERYLQVKLLIFKTTKILFLILL